MKQPDKKQFALIAILLLMVSVFLVVYHEMQDLHDDAGLASLLDEVTQLQQAINNAQKNPQQLLDTLSENEYEQWQDLASRSVFFRPELDELEKRLGDLLPLLDDADNREQLVNALNAIIHDYRQRLQSFELIGNMLLAESEATQYREDILQWQDKHTHYDVLEITDAHRLYQQALMSKNKKQFTEAYERFRHAYNLYQAGFKKLELLKKEEDARIAKASLEKDRLEKEARERAERERQRLADKKTREYERYLESIQPHLVVIPAGSFMMGDDSSEADVDESPVHEVQVKSFRIMPHELTFTQWGYCVEAGACEMPDDEGWGRGNRPVINVSWQDAKTYIDWLNKTTHRQYRLPSESEWEYAARAGSNTRYAWGEFINCSMAQYGRSRECGKVNQTTQVKSFKPNAWGLYDVHGNVYEWVEDCWNPDYRGAPWNQQPWLSGECSKRVLRGGSWEAGSSYVRSAERMGQDKNLRYFSAGFRLVHD